MAKKKSATKHTAKKSAKPKATPSPQKGAALPFASASKTKKARVFRALRKVMKDHGFADGVAAVQFEPAAAPAVPPPAASAVGPCPPGQISRIVCRRQADGTIVCKSECQPI